MRVPSVLLGILAAAASPAVRAQQPGPAVGPFSAGASFLVANPVGQFAENVDIGFGIAGHGRMAVDANDILSIRADLGFVNYGQEDIRICITLPCRVSGEITTSNDILVFGIGPEIGTGQGRIRLYTGASIGLAYFSTSSSVQGTDSDLEPFASSTNYDDLTFAWQAGPGMQLRVWDRDGARVALDLLARYHGNGEARYLRKGDIADRPDGSLELNPRQSETNFWTIGLGVSATWR